MRFYGFVSLLIVALILDIVLLGLGARHPGAQLGSSGPVVAQAVQPSATPSPPPSHTPVTPSATPTATAVPPSPTMTPSPSPTATPLPPTATPLPRLIAANDVSFTPGDRAVRANISIALNHYFGALTHVVLPPGGVFSFNSTLGVYPPALPWKDVVVKPTAAPAPEPIPPPAEPAPPADGAAPDAPVPAPEPVAPPPLAAPQRIEGGGLCDLASRYVMAARPLLPSSAFRFVNHVRSNGIRLNGVPTRDSVSIWAVGGGKSEHDLLITNTTQQWLEFRVERDGEKITVYARLWDGVPPDR